MKIHQLAFSGVNDIRASASIAREFRDSNIYVTDLSYRLSSWALAEGLRRLRGDGAKNIFMETDNWRNTAFQLYESLGFRVKRDVLVYWKDY